jgi:hypothetical protein
MFVEPNSKVGVTLQVAIPPLLEKKRQVLKFVGFFRGAMVFDKYLQHIALATYKNCNEHL